MLLAYQKNNITGEVKRLTDLEKQLTNNNKNMENKKQFIKTGVSFFRNKSEKTNSWLKGKITINLENFKAFLKDHKDLIKDGKNGKFVAFDLKYSKDKNALWLDIDEYKVNQDKPLSPDEMKEIVAEEFNEEPQVEDIGF